MKAFLLSAGYGKRLRPITNTIPKCMVEINGYPLLAWWFKLFQENEVDEVLINTHHLHEQVSEFIESYNKKNNKLKVLEAYEKELLGSGGTIRENLDFIDGDEDFLICNADNLTDISLNYLLAIHKEKKPLLSMALFKPDNFRECGTVELDPQNWIINFEEKKENPRGEWANAGIYITSKRIGDHIPDKNLVDLGQDVLSNIVGDMYGYKMNEYLIDIGSWSNYKKAQKEWQYDYNKNAFANKLLWRGN